jgi:hypothetical protein
VLVQDEGLAHHCTEAIAEFRDLRRKDAPKRVGVSKPVFGGQGLVRGPAKRKGALEDDERRAELAADFGEMVVDSLGKEVDRLEAALFERFPRLRHVALESDWNPDD